MGIRMRLVAAVVAAAMATVAVGASTATATQASPAASAPDGSTKDKGRDDVLAAVAASLHVTVKQLTTALENLKRAIGSGTGKEAAVAAFAKELKISVADAEKALQALSSDGKEKPGNGKEKPGVPREAVKLLAAELHISADRARQVFNDLEKVKGKDVRADPEFIAIANGLHITPQRLLDALIAVKKQLAAQERGKDKGKGEEKVPSGSPAK